MFGEIIKVWGTKFLIQDKYYDAEFDEEGNLIKSNEESYSYKRQIEYFLVCQGGTYGWVEAFEKTCVQCSITDVYEYYTKLDWMLSDIFDGYVIDKMLKILINDNENRDE